MKKNILLLGILALGLSLGSCEKFLQEEPADFLAAENFYQNENDAIAGLNGVFNALLPQTYYGRTGWQITELPGELIRVGSSTDERAQLSRFTYTPTNTEINSWWTNSYRMINRANDVIEKRESWARPGDPRYVDQNGDGVITATDRVIIGQAQPKFIYGVTNGFRYGGFNLSVFLQGVQGSSVLNLNRYELESGITTTNKLTTVTNRWTPTNTDTNIPRAGSTLRRSTGIVSDVLEDGSFLRVKTVTLGYTLPKFSKVIKSANVYVTAQNVLTFTKYTGYDPEVNSFGGDNLSLNTDYNAYPSTRTFIAGVRLGF